MSSNCIDNVRLTCKAVTCPRFVVIKMRISSEDWEKCVSQCSSGSIEGVAVTMLSVKMSLLKFSNKMLVNPGRFAKGLKDKPEASNSTVNLTLITTVLGFPEIFQ